MMSDGYRNMIGMIADIAYRCIKLNPHLGVDALKETNGLVLIDELDLHLHPSWQKAIVHELTTSFPKIQFVATASRSGSREGGDPASVQEAVRGCLGAV